jgi:hypothetical protein
MTIGECLARRIGARFVHNHQFLDLVEACCNRGDPRWQALCDDLRKRTYETLANQPLGESLVLTNAMAADEHSLWAKISDLAKARGDRLVPVVLHIGAEENRRRLQDPGRGGTKLKQIEVLDSLRSSAVLMVPDGPDTLEVNVTDLSAEEAAEHIRRHVDGLPGRTP